MQPNPPQPQQGQPPMVDEPSPVDGWPSPSATPKPQANAAAAMTASVLALFTAAFYLWFSLHDIFYLDNGMTGGLTSMVLVNVLGGAIGAAALLVAAGFTFTRRIPGAWTLFGLCGLYAVANTLIGPLAWGTSVSDQLNWLFGFQHSNGAAAGLATIFGLLTAIAAAIAGSVTTRKQHS